MIKNLSLRGRFLIAPALALSLLLILLAVIYSANHSQSRIVSQLSGSDLYKISQLNHVVVALKKNHTQLSRLLLSAIEHSDEERVYTNGRPLLDTLHQLEAELGTLIANHPDHHNNHQLLMGTEPLLERYRNAAISAIELVTVDSDLALKELLVADTEISDLSDLFLAISEGHVAEMKTATALVNQLQQTQHGVGAIGLVLISLLISLSLYLSRKMSTDLDQVVNAVVGLSRGKRDINLPASPDRYIARLVEALVYFKDLLTERDEKATQLETMVTSLRDSEEHLASILRLVPTGILIIDQEQNLVLFNHAAEEIFGYTREEVLGQSLDLLLPTEFHNSHRRMVKEFAEADIPLIQAMDRKPVKARKKDGETIYINASISSLHISNEQLLLAAITDVTAKKIQDDQIHFQAHYDSLTQLPNRFLALDRLGQLLPKAKRDGQKVAVLFLDLDDFKKVNDSMGHEVGDKILIEAASRLASVVRKEDTVGRLGGDEFIIMLGSLTEPTDVQPVVDSLLALFRKPFLIGEQELMLTLSIGVAIYPDDGMELSQILRHSDSAMYYAKRQGRNTYAFYTKEMNRGVARRLALEAQTNGAIERGEFEVYYQPKVRIDTGRVIGAEALLRWHNQELGSVSPNEFIPVLEQTGMIVDAGRFVLEQALTQTRQWQQHYLPSFAIAINLSPRQFRDPELVESIIESARKTEVAFESIELEITEGVLLSGHAYTADALQALCATGITLALDDFGTGYSSLSYLRQFPFGVLKIDRSFIRDINDDPQDRALVSAAVAMAHSLELTVVAEGVETEDQMATLREIDCDICQGYLLGRPLPVSQFEELLQASLSPTTS